MDAVEGGTKKNKQMTARDMLQRANDWLKIGTAVFTVFVAVTVGVLTISYDLDDAQTTNDSQDVAIKEMATAIDRLSSRVEGNNTAIAAIAGQVAELSEQNRLAAQHNQRLLEYLINQNKED